MEGFEYKKYNTERLLERMGQWPEAIKYFEDMLIRRLQEGTMDKNLSDVLSFLTYHNRPIGRIFPPDVHEWLLWTRKSRLKESTFARRLLIVKRFLCFAGRKDLADVIPYIKQKYEIRRGAATDEDIGNLITCCKSYLEKTLILLLNETGCRIGEVLTLRKYGICFDDLGVYIIVTGKTGTRPVRIMDKKVQAVLRNRYNSIEGNGLVFGGHTYNWAYWIFRRTKNLTGKEVSPHMIRHKKSTEMQKRYAEAIVKKYIGWSADSKMPRLYNHLTPKDVDMALFGNFQGGVK